MYPSTQTVLQKIWRILLSALILCMYFPCFDFSQAFTNHKMNKTSVTREITSLVLTLSFVVHYFYFTSNIYKNLNNVWGGACVDASQYWKYFCFKPWMWASGYHSSNMQTLCKAYAWWTSFTMKVKVKTDVAFGIWCRAYSLRENERRLSYLICGI